MFFCHFQNAIQKIRHFQISINMRFLKCDTMHFQYTVHFQYTLQTQHRISNISYKLSDRHKTKNVLPNSDCHERQSKVHTYDNLHTKSVLTRIFTHNSATISSHSSSPPQHVFITESVLPLATRSLLLQYSLLISCLCPQKIWSMSLATHSELLYYSLLIYRCIDNRYNLNNNNNRS